MNNNNNYCQNYSNNFNINNYCNNHFNNNNCNNNYNNNNYNINNNSYMSPNMNNANNIFHNIIRKIPIIKEPNFKGKVWNIIFYRFFLNSQNRI